MTFRNLAVICWMALGVLACDPSPGPSMDSGPGMDTRRPNECASPRIDCDGICVTIRTNPLNCGACGVECARDETCASGTCRSLTTCPDGQMDCDGCTNVTTDPMHCGRCGELCDEGETCTGGACTPPTCEGETPDRCGEICTNSMTDGANCGMCGTMCADGETCTDGSCASACGTDTACAVEGADVCVNTMTDAAHCGSCGMACEAGQGCTAGVCGCAGDEMTCGGACTNTSTDPAHCGGCGLACDEGSTCASGRCECPSGTEECAGRCVNTQTDGTHCGGCGTMCPGTQICVAGSCTGAGGCSGGELDCGGSCVDINTTAEHCGMCGNACAAATTCSGGVCRPENDLRANATTITLPASGAEFDVVGTTTGATADVPTLSCDASGPNVWFSVTLPGQGVLWVDTAASDYDTAIFIANSAGEPIAGLCNDDCPCEEDGDFGLLDSCMGKRVEAGTYFISVGGSAASDTGDFLLHVQFLPKGDSYLYARRLNAEGTTLRTAVLSTSGAMSMTCGGPTTADSGEDVRWFMSCGGTRTHLLSTCPGDGGTWVRAREEQLYDPVVYIRSAQTGMETACNDDDRAHGCHPEGGGPRFGARIADHQAVRGVSGVYIDSRDVVGGGLQYELFYNVPNYTFE